MIRRGNRPQMLCTRAKTCSCKLWQANAHMAWHRRGSSDEKLEALGRQAAAASAPSTSSSVEATPSTAMRGRPRERGSNIKTPAAAAVGPGAVPSRLPTMTRPSSGPSHAHPAVPRASVQRHAPYYAHPALPRASVQRNKGAAVRGSVGVGSVVPRHTGHTAKHSRLGETKFTRQMLDLITIVVQAIGSSAAVLQGPRIAQDLRPLLCELDGEAKNVGHLGADPSLDPRLLLLLLKQHHHLRDGDAEPPILGQAPGHETGCRPQLGPPGVGPQGAGVAAASGADRQQTGLGLAPTCHKHRPWGDLATPLLEEPPSELHRRREVEDFPPPVPLHCRPRGKYAFVRDRYSTWPFPTMCAGTPLWRWPP
mmetsp:Transcript_146969/g.469656  ORF Transcript_146969/g.469656 Transcript_146969/m.469656 type:complete len:366 (-) Transcript_146969:297-1394(-)